MKQTNPFLNKVFLIIALCLLSKMSFTQSFNDEKTSMINYIKRMYNSSPFEGAKLIEANEISYHIAAISLYLQKNSLEENNILAERKAQEAAKITFAEPCIQFEILATISDDIKKTTTYLFSCTPLSEFIKGVYKKQTFDGAKIIAAPSNNYFVSVVSIDTQKYTSESLMDRVALIKAKQQANSLFNGSVINSDLVIQTDGKTGNIASTEIIREQSVGFVDGLETLSKYTLNDKKVYIFYRELSKQ